MSKPLVPLVYSVTLPLAVAQTIFWASTFYLLPALLPVLERDAGWSRAEISFALTGALLVSAACAPFAGKIIDRGKGRMMMQLAGIVSALLLLAFSATASSTILLLVWLTMGICMASMLYDPCFSILTRHLGNDARKTITQVTLIAGFAGTIAYPVANAIAHSWDWQTAVRFFAVLVLFVAAPLTWFGLGRLESLKPAEAQTQQVNNTDIKQHRALFWLLGIAFTLAGICHNMTVTHLLPLLNDRGLALQTAVIAAMLIGPMQVVGRIVLISWQSALPNKLSSLVCIIGSALSALALLLAGASAPLIFFAVALQGASWGIVSIMRPALAREMLGQAQFGSIAGKMASLFTLGLAFAPIIGTGLWKAGGYDLMLIVGTTLAATGAILLKVAIIVAKKN